MERSPIRFVSPPGCTTGSRGVTLVELIIVLAAALALGAGLVTTLLFGIEVWERSMRRLDIQRTGNLLLGELTRSVQKADGLEIRGNELVVQVSKDEAIIYRIHENQLVAVAGDANLHPMGLGTGDSVKVIPSEEHKPFSWENPGTTIRICFDLAYRTDRIDEQYRFETVVFGRNSR